MRLAAGIEDALKLVTEKHKKVSKVREETMNSVVTFDLKEFSEVSTKS